MTSKPSAAVISTQAAEIAPTNLPSVLGPAEIGDVYVYINDADKSEWMPRYALMFGQSEPEQTPFIYHDSAIADAGVLKKEPTSETG